MKGGTITQTSNPSFKRRSPRCSLRPQLKYLMGNRPTPPGCWRYRQGIKKQYFARVGNNRFYECLLLFPSIVSNNPDIQNMGISICSMAMLPFMNVKWSTLKFNRPTHSILMPDKDIRNAIRLGQTFLQCDGSLRKLYAQPVGQYTLTTSVPYGFSFCAPGAFALLVCKMELSAFFCSTAYMYYATTVGTTQCAFVRPAL